MPAANLQTSPEVSSQKVLLVSMDKALAQSVQSQMVDILGLDICECQGSASCQNYVQSDAATVLLAVVDLVTADSESLDYLEQQRIPVIGLFSRDQDNHRLTGRHIVASLDKDKPEELTRLADSARQVFQNRLTRVVVLHSQQQQLNYFCDLLNDHYYSVLPAADVAEAMELLNLYPDTRMLLLDEESTQLGTMNVIKLLRRNHARDRLAVLALTVRRDAVRTANLFVAGANDVITSSTDDVELIARVRHQADMIELARKERHKVFRDPVTLAYSMDYYQDVAARYFASAQRENLRFALAVVNINNFRQINQQHGAASGNQVLRAVARKLSTQLRDTDFVARKAGDEFICVISSAGSDEIASVMQRIQANMRQQGVWYGRLHIPVTVSIGASCDASATLEFMQTRSELALAQARKAGPDSLLVL